MAVESYAGSDIMFWSVGVLIVVCVVHELHHLSNTVGQVGGELL